MINELPFLIMGLNVYLYLIILSSSYGSNDLLIKVMTYYFAFICSFLFGNYVVVKMQDSQLKILEASEKVFIFHGFKYVLYQTGVHFIMSKINTFLL